ncbi:MAG TPA: HAD-IC family P-type ATPase, partial [Candidatus Norongarragalinales archaeon]|nr:HAD-IC family P-type ATPase [Candidatus Norongarragalinales archaeon]
VVSLLLGETLDGLAILVIVLVFSVFGFYQEFRAEKAIYALKKMAVVEATVFRDDRECRIDSHLLVPGDVIVLDEGAKVPADARLFEAFDLQTSEAALTGESLPVEKKDAALRTTNVALAERQNMLYLGTHVTRGMGKAIVVATGMKTELGKIAQLVQDTEEPPTPLQNKLQHLGKSLGLLALVAVGIIFLTGFLAGVPLLRMFLTAVALAVAAVPEGLPAVVTITLAVGVTRMVKRNALIRKLPAVETLGSATVICTDKTGTLTKNEMTVRHVFVDGSDNAVSGTGYYEDGTIQGANTSVRELLLQASALCNTASLSSEGVVGDPTEAALIVLAKKGGILVDALRSVHPIRTLIPFSSEKKRMATQHDFGGKKRVFSKGALEVILPRCTALVEKGKKRILSESDRTRILKQNEAYASKGLRVLALAYKPDSDDLDTGLVFVGLAAIDDPP